MRIRAGTISKVLTGALTAGVFGLASVGAHAATTFETDVGTSIDLGLAWLDSQGAFNNPSAAGDGEGLVLLALMEKRPDASSAAQGYAGASAADQARMRRVVRSIVDHISAQGINFYAYRDGGYMMALSVYLRTGGPDTNSGDPEFAGAPMQLIPAMNQVVDRTLPTSASACPTSAVTSPRTTVTGVTPIMAAAMPRRRS